MCKVDLKETKTKHLFEPPCIQNVKQLNYKICIDFNSYYKERKNNIWKKTKLKNWFNFSELKYAIFWKIIFTYMSKLKKEKISIFVWKHQLNFILFCVIDFCIKHFILYFIIYKVNNNFNIIFYFLLEINIIK